MIKLKNSVIVNGKREFPLWRPVKEYLDTLQSEEEYLVERNIAEFVFKRIDKVKKDRFYNLQPNQGLKDVQYAPLNDENKPLLGFDSSGKPRSTTITVAKLLSHPHEVYEARIHLNLKEIRCRIVKRIVFKIIDNNGINYKVYTDYCDKTKYSSDKDANVAVTSLAFTCEDVVTNIDFQDLTMKEYFSEGVCVND